MNILLTVSPTEAVQLLNGTLATLIRKWKVPLGTAYIAVKKDENGRVANLVRSDYTMFGGKIETFIQRWGFMQVKNNLLLSGKVVAKCEIKGIAPIIYSHGSESRTDGYSIVVAPLTVLDKPMEVGKFTDRSGGHIIGDGYTEWEPPKHLSRLPSRWQAVEVGE